eukprot:12430199-Karenia_brevis.AAC.1
MTPEEKDAEVEEEERGNAPGGAASNDPLPTAGGDSAQVTAITSQFLADKRNGAPSMEAA